MTAIAANHAPINTAPIYDVSNDPWLGQQNSLELITTPLAGNKLLVMRRNGDISVMSCNRNLKKHLTEQCNLLAPEAITRKEVQQFTTIATDKALESASVEACCKQYQKLNDNDRFYLLSLTGHSRGQMEPAHKVKRSEKTSRYEWPHRTKQNEATQSTRSFCGPATNTLLLSEKEHDTINAMIQDPAVRGCYSVSEYHEATDPINMEILRLAKAMGARVKFTLFNYTTRAGSVTIGKVCLTIRLTSVDTLDLISTVDGVTLEQQNDVVSVPGRIVLSNSILPTCLSYSELGATGFNMLNHAVNHSKNQ